MQNVVTQLQELIKRHYGLSSELVLKPILPLTGVQNQSYSSTDQTLSIPLLEPKTNRALALFKIKNLISTDKILMDRLNDMVQVTLQSYINLLDQMAVTEDLMQYMQIQLNPQKIIRLQDKDTQHQKIIKGAIKLGSPAPADPVRQTEILLYSKSRQVLDNLAVHIHDVAQNRFFIRMDHMPANFLTRLNDLTGLQQTTLYIPRIHLLSHVQQKTLEAYFLLEENRSETLLIVAGTRMTIPELVEENVSESLLAQFHLFHLLSEGANAEGIGFDTLSHCASAVLGMKINSNLSLINNKLSLTKSYNLIPSLQHFFPTVH